MNFTIRKIFLLLKILDIMINLTTIFITKRKRPKSYLVFLRLKIIRRNLVAFPLCQNQISYILFLAVQLNAVQN